MKNNIFVILLALTASPFLSQAMQKPDIINERTPNTGDTSLIEAARAGNLQTVQFLLEWGADPELKNYAGVDALDEARKRRNDNPEVYSAIYNAVQKKNKERFFAGYNPDEIALHDAVLYGRLDEARSLLAKGTNVNITPGPNKDSLLYIAINRVNPAMIRLLLAAGASVSYRNTNGTTALNIAERTEMDPNVKREIKQLLLDAQNKTVPTMSIENRLEKLIRAKEAGQMPDYRSYETDVLNKLLTYIWPMLDVNNQKPIVDLAARLRITPHNAWAYLSAMKEEIIQALLAGQLDMLIQAKKAQRAINYGPTSYTLPNLQTLHAKVVSMLDTNNQQPLLAVAQRLAITPYDMWNYLQAIKQDLETVMSQRR